MTDRYNLHWSHTRIFPVRVWAGIWAIFLSPYVYGLPMRIRAAHTGIAGIPWFAHMRMSARTRMHICPIHSTSS